MRIFAIMALGLALSSPSAGIAGEPGKTPTVQIQYDQEACPEKREPEKIAAKSDEKEEPAAPEPFTRFFGF
ncbi:MAG: hypothetical protein AAGB02_05775 [Pseudomonadota bacterium]